jgi:hypothetical protein
MTWRAISVCPYNTVEHYSERLAALTPGFAGADIANVVNEAALVAVGPGAYCLPSHRHSFEPSFIIY